MENENWKKPYSEGILIQNIYNTLAIVKLDTIKKHHEEMGCVFKECPNYKGEILLGGYSFPEMGNAIAIIEVLGFTPGTILIPGATCIALLPFGGFYAIAIAPRIDEGSP